MGGTPVREDSVQSIWQTAVDPNPAEGIASAICSPSSFCDEADSSLDDAPSLPSQSTLIVRSRPLNNTTMPATPVKKKAPVSGSTARADRQVKAAPKPYRLLPLDFNKLPLAAGEDFHREMRFAPEPATPTPSSGVSIWGELHDPYMGAECLMGFGERSKPFPWLNGGQVVEEPKWVEDSVKIEEHEKIRREQERGTRADYQRRRLKLVSPIIPPRYEALSRLPHDLDDFDRFDRDIEPVILEVDDCKELFVSAILDYVKENLPNLMELYSFDPRTGQPGPHIDIMRIVDLVNDNESVRQDVGKDVFELVQHMTRYIAAWDLVLKVRREIYALEVHQVNILRKGRYMRAHPEKYTENMRELNYQRRMESSRELDDRLRKLSIAEEGVNRCTEALQDCKDRVYPRPWDVLLAYDKWIVERDMGLISGPFVWHPLKDQITDPVDRFWQDLSISEQPGTPDSLSDMCLEG